MKRGYCNNANVMTEEERRRLHNHTFLVFTLKLEAQLHILIEHNGSHSHCSRDFLNKLESLKMMPAS